MSPPMIIMGTLMRVDILLLHSFHDLRARCLSVQCTVGTKEDAAIGVNDGPTGLGVDDVGHAQFITLDRKTASQYILSRGDA